MLKHLLLSFFLLSTVIANAQRFVTDIDTSKVSTIPYFAADGSIKLSQKPNNFQFGFNQTAFAGLSNTIVIGRHGFANKPSQIVFAYDSTSQLRFDDHITHNDVVVQRGDVVNLLEDMICANRLNMTYVTETRDTTMTISARTIVIKDKRLAMSKRDQIFLANDKNYLSFRKDGSISYNNRLLGTSDCIVTELYSIFRMLASRNYR